MGNDTIIRPADLRAILEYVPLYRGQTFVVSFDGSIVDCENFQNLIVDIAVLCNLGIKIVIVHGIGKQLKARCAELGITPSDVYGTEPVDDDTLKVACECTAEVSQTIKNALAIKDLKCASSNAVRPTQTGIISGVDFLNAGKIEKIDFQTLENLISIGVIPILSPIAPDRNGKLLRINSDLLSAELAMGLRASKLIYLTETSGLAMNNENAIAVALNDLQSMLDQNGIDPRALSKAKYAAKALSSTFTQRAHILNGKEFACLLTEVFDTVGCGTMIYADEYQKIRSATKSDLITIYNISKLSSQEQNLVDRTLDEIEKNISSYYVYEIDASIIAFVCLNKLDDESAELASLHVQQFYQGNNVGTTLVEFITKKARELGYKKLFTLSTKSAPFFKLHNFEEISPSTLPAERFKKYELSKRHSIVLCKTLLK